MGLPTEVTTRGRNLGKRELQSRNCGHMMLSVFLMKLLPKVARARISQGGIYGAPTVCSVRRV